ncbi:uncharacterized protein BO96DRAFT_493602 [Aspergillus niger CBS 101883]|nr:uncharacterized protein BO96DRAFT_493602 [Aspergillus niger CBS 101883]PYH57491.1 hypothetical protein BO96DRAFT_493602 [Aspergillus niger CBS 101883]
MDRTPPFLAEDWDSRPFFKTSGTSDDTRTYITSFVATCSWRNCVSFRLNYPVVPKGKDRLCVILHAESTVGEAETLVVALCESAQEMLDIEPGGNKYGKIPSAAR